MLGDIPGDHQTMSKLSTSVVIICACFQSLPVFSGPITSTVDDFAIVINEIHYNPLASGSFTSAQCEWIELHNRSAHAQDLSGWRFTEGLQYLFPEGTIIPGRGFLVVCHDAAAFQACHGDAIPVLAPLTLRLSDSGERITLSNADSLAVDSVRYLDEPPYPAAADGFGPTLALIDPTMESEYARAWAASLQVGGTPGAANLCARQRTELVPSRSVWRFWRGYVAPSGESGDWLAHDYDDASWETGEAPFGMGNGEFYLTQLADMEDNYATVFLRRPFTVETPADVAHLKLQVDFDDGFIAYLNGQEVARMNMAIEGMPAHSDDATGSHESGSSAVFSVAPELLEPGENILAILAANADMGSGDFLIGASLTATSLPPMAAPPRIVINEICAEPGRCWVEIRNLSAAVHNLNDYALALESEGLVRHPLTGDLAPNGFAVFSFDPLPAYSGTAVLSLGPQNQFVDALKYNLSMFTSFGRLPGGSTTGRLGEPTPDGPNLPPQLPQVQITEINYHPASEDKRDEYIELFNAGDVTIDLSDWTLEGGITYTFPQGLALWPQRYLLVVADTARAAENFDGLELTYVGEFSGALSNQSDNLILKDNVGNTVVSLRYSDDGAWPREADGPETAPDSDDPYDPGGRGMTLELRHPGLAPHAGGAWTAETEGGTPGAGRVEPEEDVAPVINDFFYDPPLPLVGKSLLFNADVQCPTVISRVTLKWRYEDMEEWVDLAMADDGMNGDGQADDGIWGCFLASLDRAGTVLFHFETENAEGTIAQWPRRWEDQPGLLRVDEEPHPNTTGGDYLYLIMTDEDLETLRTRNTSSNRLLPCAVVKDGRVYQQAKLRYRGSSSRNVDPKSYRIEMTHDQTYPLSKFFYIHGDDPHRQYMGMHTFRRAGIPGPRIRFVTMGMGDGIWSGYGYVERMDSGFVAHHFAGDDGNLYRGERCGNQSSTLDYFGDDPEDYQCGYDLETNREEGDWLDVVQLCAALDGPDETYLEGIHEILDADQWCRYFAVHTVLSNQENSIYRQSGDDYFLYARESDGRFVLLPWDMDSVFLEPEERLFRPDLAAVRRFLTHPAIAPRYWYHLEKMVNRTFTTSAVARSMAEAQGLISGNAVNEFLTFRRERTDFIRSQLFQEITACGLVTDTPAELDPLIPRNAQWRYFKGTEDPSEDIVWTTAEFDDQLWEEDTAGFGYGDDDDETVLDDMRGEYLTVYLRRRFNLDAPEDIASYRLWMNYDDAFVCYLNGQEIARGNLNAAIEIPHFDDSSGFSHEAGNPETVDLAPFTDIALAGDNVLAVIGLNARITSSDFSLHPAILSKTADITSWPAGCGTPLFAQAGASLALSGSAPVTGTSFVSVNGEDAGYDVLSGQWALEWTVGEELEPLVVTAWDYDGLPIATSTMEFTASQPVEAPRNIDADLTFTPGQGPILLDDVTVRQDARLTIEPGCQLLFGSDEPLTVQGELIIAGTIEQPVTLQRAADSQDALITVDGGSAELTGALVTPGSPELPGTTGAMGTCHLISGTLTLTDCTFTGTAGYGVSAEGGTLSIDHCIFQNAGAGLGLQNADATVLNSTFRNLAPGDGIRHRSGGDLTINECRFQHITGSGINTTRPSTIAASSFLDIHDTALAFFNAAEGTVEDTLIARTNTGVRLAGNATFGFNHITLVENNLGFSVETAGGGTAQGTLNNGILWDNSRLAALQGMGQLAIQNSLVQDSAFAGVDGNFTADPLFTAPGQQNWTLTMASPAVMRADDGTDLGALQTGAMPYLAGDINDDEVVNLADVVALLDYLFVHGTTPPCPPLADTNGDEVIDLSDAVYLLLYLFNEGEAPAPPATPCP